jgi:hypothetical protein
MSDDGGQMKFSWPRVAPRPWSIACQLWALRANCEPFVPTKFDAVELRSSNIRALAPSLCNDL